MPTPTHVVFRVLLETGQPPFTIHEHIDVSVRHQGVCGVAYGPSHTHTHQVASYTCDFHLVQRVDGDQYVAYTAIEKATTSLSFEHGFQCQLDYGEIHKDERAFDALDQALEWSASVEPVRAILYPLTCGSYTLKGGLMNYETGFHAPIIMRIELLTSGELTGTGVGCGFNRQAPSVALRGSWTSETLEIWQQFSFPLHPTMELFGFRGQVTKYAFMGVYVYGDQTFEEQEEEDIQSAVLWVTRMRRVWSLEVHALFPDQFKTAVWWLLLSSLRRSEARTMRLPSVLWPRVLEYCDSQWFA